MQSKSGTPRRVRSADIPDSHASESNDRPDSAAAIRRRRARYHARVRVLLLDVDGVLNRTGYRPAESRGLVSWIEPELAVRVAREAAALDARIVLASDWRIGRTHAALREARGTHGLELHDVTPSSCGGGRWREITAWLQAHGVAAEATAILDDAFDMGELAHRHVRISPLRGFDDDAAVALRALIDADYQRKAAPSSSAPVSPWWVDVPSNTGRKRTCSVPTSRPNRATASAPDRSIAFVPASFSER